MGPVAEEPHQDHHRKYKNQHRDQRADGFQGGGALEKNFALGALGIAEHLELRFEQIGIGAFVFQAQNQPRGRSRLRRRNTAGGAPL